MIEIGLDFLSVHEFLSGLEVLVGSGREIFLSVEVKVLVMGIYDKILVPTDGSEGASVSVDHAIEIAEKFDAEVHILYVVDVRASTAGDVWANMVGRFHEIGEDSTSAIAERLRNHGIESVKKVLEGVPHQEINSYADGNGIDLIVMGTQGRTGLDRVLLGSTTEKVVRTSDVPVMTVDRSE